MAYVRLCPRAGPVTEPQSQGDSSEGIQDDAYIVANRYAEDLVIRRNREISEATHGAATWNDTLEALISALENENRIPSNDIPQTSESSTRPSSATARPLEENILAIVWEINHSGMSQAILEPWINIQSGKIQDFVTLLSLAATFEIKCAKVSFRYCCEVNKLS